MKNQFEQHIKQSLEGFEADYNPSDWSDMQNKLNKAKIVKSNKIGKGLMIAASIIIVGSLAYYFSTSHLEKEATSVHPIAAQKGNSANEDNTQFKRAPEEVQINNSHVTITTKTNQDLNNSDSKKEVSVKNETGKDDKTSVVEKTVSTATATVSENGTKIQEQIKEPVVAEILPVQPPANLFNASFHSDVNKVCAGTEVRFVPDNKDGSCTYKWSFGDGGSSSEQSPSHVFAEAGTYVVRLHVLSAKDRKQADQKNTMMVVAAPSVQMNYVVSDDNSLLVNFEANADKVTEWKWNFGDKQTASVQNPSHTYGKKGNYKIEVTAKNAAGCSTVISKEMNLKSNLNLLAPNAFSPDGNGVNDTWMPVALLNGDYTFTLTIYDKAGNVVFKTSDKNHPWEGQNTNKGETFIWRAIVKDKNGDEIPCQGLITVSE